MGILQAPVISRRSKSRSPPSAAVLLPRPHIDATWWIGVRWLKKKPSEKSAQVKLYGSFSPKKLLDEPSKTYFKAPDQSTSRYKTCYGHILPQNSNEHHRRLWHQPTNPSSATCYDSILVLHLTENQEQHMGSGIGSDFNDLPMK